MTTSELAITFFTATTTLIGGLFAYHKFLMNKFDDNRREMFKEVSKLKDSSDERDKEIKESLKELKQDLVKRDDDLKSVIKEMKEDLKADLNFLRDKYLEK